MKSFLHSAHVFLLFFLSLYMFLSVSHLLGFFLITLLHLVLLPPVLSFLVLFLLISSHASLGFLYHPLQLFKRFTDFRYIFFANFPTLAPSLPVSIGTLTFFLSINFSYLPMITILILVLLTPLHLLTSLISTFTLLLIPSTNQLFFRNSSLTLNLTSLLSLKPGYHLTLFLLL